MTISPPSKVKLNHKISPDILASGIDTLVLTINVEWENELFFDHLSLIKQLAVEDKKDTAIIFRNDEETKEWAFSIKPHGSKGHAWIISSPDFDLTIGNWQKPQSRPSIMARISSEALWRMGPIEACDDLQNFIKAQHGKIHHIKPSRLDICTDLLFPSDLWSEDLIHYCVTRAANTALYHSHRTLTEISIGKGHVSARFYDKIKEIATKSNKLWMFDVWQTIEFPIDHKLIRIEFQLRREALKSLGIEILENLFSHTENIWAYCTKKWLKLQDNPGAHSSQRHTFMWWEVIQNSFLGIQNATPLIRCKSIQVKEKQQFAAIYGNLSSLAAIECEKNERPLHHSFTFKKTLAELEKLTQKYDKNDFRFSIDIQDKRVRYHRKIKKMIEVHQKRQELNHPSNLPVDKIIIKQMENEQWQKNTLQLLNSVKESKLRRER